MADTTIKLSGTYDSIEAYNILEEMRNMSSDYEEIRTEAAAAASAATAAVATAQAAVTNATTASNNAQTYAGNANDSATAAAGSASSASTAATNALDSQTAAAGSASAAATSASEASASATEAEASAQSMSAFLLQRNTRYAVGDVAYSANLGTRYYLKCTVVGTTGATEPSMGSVVVGDEITDGTVTWVVEGYLPLSGGTMTGNITLADGGNPLSTAGGTMTGKIIYNGINSEEFSLGLSSTTNVDFGWNYGNKDGAIIGLRSNSDTNSGEFELSARNKSLSKSLIGKPDGTLTWAGKNVLTDNVENVSITTAISFKSGYNERGGVLRIVGGTIVQLKLGFNITSNVTAGTVANIGTLASAYRPPNDAFGGSADGNLYVSNDGNMQFRFFSNKSAGSWAWCTVCYLLL